MKHIYKLVFLILVSTLNADQISFQFNNDVFAGTDRHYSNGLALSWMDDTYDHEVTDSTSYYSRFMLGLFNVTTINGLEKSKKYSAGASLSHAIITPEDVSKSEAQYNDAPYVGFLNLSLYVFEWDDNSFNEYRMNLRVIGENAGEEVQNGFHSIIGNEDAKGWDTQLNRQFQQQVQFPPKLAS
ncbi:lipid A-modifier LpxR family protein [Sulfurimonas sp.]|uniref:lipid A-modifier LpxR family protein n=1 Tax=Sulfurimonas sp. TaxID=2022749 RepID=UPI0025DB4475|nr:lipid A-modifier LpxR family protein [Sulfurimonas sp.]